MDNPINKPYSFISNEPITRNAMVIIKKATQERTLA